MKTTKPVFIVGSGRSGTRMIYKLFSGIQNVEIYHEYCCTHIQPLSAKYYMKLISKKEVTHKINSIYNAAITYSKANYFIDSSNKLSWIIKELYELFPNALFINITRDGRNVSSSFLHKLSNEIYDDQSVAILNNWICNPKKYPEPPPEKKYWWNIPQKDDYLYKQFQSFSQFERIVWHWTEVYRVINQSFSLLPKNQCFTVKLEDLTSKSDVLKNLCSFIGIPYHHDLFTFVKKPQGVIFPIDFKLTPIQKKQFWIIAKERMAELGYEEKEEYKVNY